MQLAIFMLVVIYLQLIKYLGLSQNTTTRREALEDQRRSKTPPRTHLPDPPRYDTRWTEHPGQEHVRGELIGKLLHHSCSGCKNLGCNCSDQGMSSVQRSFWNDLRTLSLIGYYINPFKDFDGKRPTSVDRLLQIIGITKNEFISILESNRLETGDSTGTKSNEGNRCQIWRYGTILCRPQL